MTFISNTDPKIRSRLADTFYTGRTQYCRNPQSTKVKRHDGNSRSSCIYSMPRNKPLDSRLCWGCVIKGRIPYQCHQLKAENVAMKFQNYQRGSFKEQTKATKRLLFKLCQELYHDVQPVYS